jgi:hypothetical protein
VLDVPIHEYRGRPDEAIAGISDRHPGTDAMIGVPRPFRDSWCCGYFQEEDACAAGRKAPANPASSVHVTGIPVRT